MNDNSWPQKKWGGGYEYIEKELIQAMHNDNKAKIYEILVDNWFEVTDEMKIRVKEMYKDYEPIRNIYNIKKYS